MTSHYDILKSWIDSCDNELQLDNIGTFVADKLITDDKQRDDIIDYLRDTIKNRAWIRAKVIQRDYVPAPDRSPVCDEHIEIDPLGYVEPQPTDQCSH